MGWVSRETKRKAELAARGLEYAKRRKRKAKDEHEAKRALEWEREAEKRWNSARKALVEESKR